MITNKLCITLSRYAKVLEGNVSYTLSKIFEKEDIDKFIDHFKYDDYSSFSLTSQSKGRNYILNVMPDQVCLINTTDYLVEEYVINTAGDLNKTTYEIRPRGIIVEEEKKIYRTPLNSKGEKVNTVFESRRYCFTNKTINELVKNPFTSTDLNEILNNFREEYHEYIRFVADSEADCKTFYSSFIKTDHLNLYTSDNPEKYDSSTIHVYVNGEEISYYDLINNKESLETAHDLFMGKVNKYTIDEILAISMGIIDEEAFDLYSELGFESRENCVVGSSLVKKTDQFRKNSTKLIAENYNCSRFKIIETRQDIIDIIRSKRFTKEGSARTRK